MARFCDAGILSRNEARAQLGLDADPSPIAGVLAVRTPSGVAPISGDAKVDTKDQQEVER